MLRNRVGIRVVQRLLELAPDEHRAKLVDAIRGAADVKDVCERHKAAELLTLLN